MGPALGCRVVDQVQKHGFVIGRRAGGDGSYRGRALPSPQHHQLDRLLLGVSSNRAISDLDATSSESSACSAHRLEAPSPANAVSLATLRIRITVVDSITHCAGGVAPAHLAGQQL